MIDTIKIAIQLTKPSHTAEDLRSLGWRKRCTDLGKFYRFYKEKKGSRYPYLSIYESPIGQKYLWVSVSLPAFYCGSNAKLLDENEIKEALRLLSIYVTKKSGECFNAETATVWNVDFAKDYFVGEDSIRPMIGRLSKMDISRFNSGRYSQTTCYFHSKGSGSERKKPRTICLYGKYEDAKTKGFSDADVAATNGILRSEFRYRDKRAVYRLCEKLDLPNHQAGVIFTKAVSDFVLAPLKNQISLLRNASNSRDKIYRLISKYGTRHARGLSAFLIYRDTFGTDFYKIDALGFSKSHYRACMKECREVGIWDLLEESNIPIKIEDLP